MRSLQYRKADGIRDSGFGLRDSNSRRDSGFENPHSERIPNPKSQIPTLNAIADTADGIRDSGFGQPTGFGFRNPHSERIPNPKSQTPTLNAIADTADGIRDSGFGIRTAD